MLDAETKEVLTEIQNMIQEADACLKRGNRYLDEGSPDLALVEFDRGIDIHPHGPELYIGRSSAHLEKGDHAKALEDLDRSISKRPISIAYLNRGAILTLLGDWDRALSNFKEAEKLDPQIRSASKYARAHWYKGVCYESKGQHDVAVRCFNKARRLDPTRFKT